MKILITPHRAGGGARCLLARLAIVGATAIALSSVPHHASAQRGPGMPDMSNAPADVQAIWKKMMSGATPTPAEAKRLSDWMIANKDKIVKAGLAHGDSMRQAAKARFSSASGADQKACPDKVALPASLSFDPNADAASALLDSLRRLYTAQLAPKSAQDVQHLIGVSSDPRRLNLIGGALYLKGWVTPAVLVFIAEAAHAPPSKAQGAWGDLGAALLGAGDPLHAVRVMRRALLLGGRTALYVSDLGIAYADLGELGTATTLLSEATRLQPSLAQAWDALARVQSCAGNVVAAAHAREQAQDVDWDDSRQDEIDQHDKADPNKAQGGDDDAVEAAKPLPDPPGRSPFPAPPGGGVSSFDAYSPKLGGTWREQAVVRPYDIGMEGAYHELESQIGRETMPHPPRTLASAPTSAATTVVFRISNGDQALRGMAVVDRRAGAKASMMVQAWTTKTNSDAAQTLARAVPIATAFHKCTDTQPGDVCKKPYCRAMESLVEQSYAEQRGATAVLIGGLSGLAAQVNTKMNTWFTWAGDPAARRIIDQHRRLLLAELEAFAYMAAAGTNDAVPELCESITPGSHSAEAKDDAKRDPGECKARSIHLPQVVEGIPGVTMDADCHEMKMTIDDEVLGRFGSPTLEIQRASSTKNGKIFIGVTGDALDGLVSGSIGLQVTWDNGGWVQSSGVAAAGEGGVDGVAHVSGDLGFDPLASGSGVSGSAAGSVPAFGFAPSVNFSGR